MELRVLEYYLMVAREENITKAAELLHITQPTLSRQLSQMEAELGVKLFTRGKHSISLTADGLLLKRRAQELVDLARKTRQELKHDEEELSGVISIGSGETWGMHVLADRMAEFHRKHPQVTFDLYSATADQIKERLEKGLTDIGLLTEPVEIGKYQFIRLEEKNRWGVLVRRDSELAEKMCVTPEDLLDIPLLLPGRNQVRSELENWFGEYYEKLHVAAGYNLLNNAAVLAESMNGAAVCMEYVSEYQNLKFIPLEPVLETGAVVVWKRNQFLSPLMERFTEYLKDRLRNA